jgi:hypothetical protein
MVKKTPPVLNRKMNQRRDDGESALRVYDRAAAPGRMARRLIKCGCCDESIEIYHDETTLEVNGVYGSIQNWREVLLPLLGANS